MSFASESRRQFLRRAGLAAAGAGAISRLAGPETYAGMPAPSPAMAQRQMRGYAAGNFFLTLDGVKGGSQ